MPDRETDRGPYVDWLEARVTALAEALRAAETNLAIAESTLRRIGAEREKAVGR